MFLPYSGPGTIPFASESADGLPDHKQITQEFRLESDYQGNFNWQAVLFWYKEDITIDSFNYDSLTPGNPRAGHAIQQQKNDAWAVFASGEYQATEKLKLRGDSLPVPAGRRSRRAWYRDHNPSGARARIPATCRRSGQGVTPYQR